MKESKPALGVQSALLGGISWQRLDCFLEGGSIHIIDLSCYAALTSANLAVRDQSSLTRITLGTGLETIHLRLQISAGPVPVLKGTKMEGCREYC